MDLLRAIDAFLFGPTVAYEATTRYSLEDSIARLRQVTLSRFNPLSAFRCGLIGIVDDDEVAVRWHRKFRSTDMLSPCFDGSFQANDKGVRLIGTIGVRRGSKFGWAVGFPVLIALLSAYLLSSRGGDRAWAWFFVVFPLVWISIPVLTRRFCHGDYQRIADALDAALS